MGAIFIFGIFVSLKCMKGMGETELNTAKVILDLISNLFLLIILPLSLFFAFNHRNSIESARFNLEISKQEFENKNDNISNNKDYDLASELLDQNLNEEKRIQKIEGKAFWAEYFPTLITPMLGTTQFTMLLSYEFQVHKNKKKKKKYKKRKKTINLS